MSDSVCVMEELMQTRVGRKSDEADLGCTHGEELEIGNEMVD